MINGKNPTIGTLPPKPDINALYRWAKTVQHLLDTGERRTRDVESSYVKVRDLVSLGIPKESVYAAIGSSTGSAGGGLSPGTSSDWLGDILLKTFREKLEKSFGAQMRALSDTMYATIQTVADRVEEVNDIHTNNETQIKSAIGNYALVHSGAACRIGAQYYTPKEFYSAIKNEGLPAIEARAEQGFPSFANDCVAAGGTVVDSAAVNRELDLHNSAFNDFVNGAASSSEYSTFIQTLSTDSDAWSSFRRKLEATIGFACFDSDGNPLPQYTDRGTCESAGGYWDYIGTNAQKRAWMDQNDIVAAGYGCYDPDNWTTIVAGDKASCELQGGVWVEHSVASQFSQMKSELVTGDTTLDSKINSVEQTLSTEIQTEANRITTLESTVSDNYTALNSRIDTVDSTYANATSTNATRITNLESTTNNLGARVTSVESTTSSLSGSVASVETRLSAAESSMSQKAEMRSDGSGYWQITSNSSGTVSGMRFKTGAASEVVVDANAFKVGQGTLGGAMPIFNVVNGRIQFDPDNLDLLGTGVLPGIARAVGGSVQNVQLPYASNRTTTIGSITAYSPAQTATRKYPWNMTVIVSVSMAVDTTLYESDVGGYSGYIRVWSGGSTIASIPVSLGDGVYSPSCSAVGTVANIPPNTTSQSVSVDFWSSYANNVRGASALYASLAVISTLT